MCIIAYTKIQSSSPYIFRSECFFIPLSKIQSISPYRFPNECFFLPLSARYPYSRGSPIRSAPRSRCLHLPLILQNHSDHAALPPEHIFDDLFLFFVCVEIFVQLPCPPWGPGRCWCTRNDCSMPGAPRASRRGYDLGNKEWNWSYTYKQTIIKTATFI